MAMFQRKEVSLRSLEEQLLEEDYAEHKRELPRGRLIVAGGLLVTVFAALWL